MALHGTTCTTIKEFFYLPAGHRVKLVSGFDNDRLAYYAVEVKKGLNLTPGDKEYGVIEAQVFGPGDGQYAVAAGEFKSLILKYL